MRTILTLMVLVLSASCVKQNFGSITTEVASDNSFDTVTETALPVHTQRLIQINSNVSGYYETLPALYAKTTKRYPLIIFNHGIGELGTGLSRLNCCGLPYHAARGTFPARFYNSRDGKYYSFIVVSPQFRVRASAAQLQSVVDYAKNKYRVDPSRIYVVGLSLGGGETMDWSEYYGQNAAAIFPSCPGRSPDTARARRIASKNLPIWWTYSTLDQAVPEQQGYTWQKYIDGYNPTFAPLTKLTVWTDLSHNGTWARAFNPITKVDGKNAYEWLLQYTRSTNIPPVASTSEDRIIPLNWNYMPMVYGTTSTDADGWIAAFRWTQISGAAATIASPNSGNTRITGLVAGTYVFRLMVTDNKGATDTDDITITMTP